MCQKKNQTRRNLGKNGWQKLSDRLAEEEKTSNTWFLSVGSPCPAGLVSNMNLPSHVKVLVVVQDDLPSCWYDDLWVNLLSRAQVQVIATIQCRYDSNRR